MQADGFIIAQQILNHIIQYLENLTTNITSYFHRVQDALLFFKAENELYLNKVHKAIASRVADYILIIKTIYAQVFDELLPLLLKDNKKLSKKDMFYIINQ